MDSMAYNAAVVRIEATTSTPSPGPSRTVVDLPSSGALDTAGAAVAIVLALGAGILGYRIIRGGRGL